jgi:hypothetical protein
VTTESAYVSVPNRRLTQRRRKRWCYECQTYTLCHRYPTHLLEEQIDLCDRCAEDVA